jgi:hypothetical protein
MFHPRHTLTRDSSATHTTLALRIASINHTCGLNIAPYSSLMSWVCFIFIPMLCEPTTRKSILDLILLFGAQLFNMASAVQSRLDYHCNAIHMRSTYAVCASWGDTYRSLIGTNWHLVDTAEVEMDMVLWLMAIGDSTRLRAKSHKSRYHESDGNKCMYFTLDNFQSNAIYQNERLK